MKSVQFMLPTAAVLCGLLMISNFASAQTWVLQTSAPTNDAWHSVASSADGSKMVAVIGGPIGVYNILGSIYTSTDSGITWLQQSNAPNMNWQSVASSADGNNLIAAAGSQSGSLALRSGIYTSTNAGVTWVSNNLPVLFWNGVASSADGSKLMAVSIGSVFTSTNYGAMWTSNDVSNYGFRVCASSADGTKLITGGGSGPISISTNSGEIWTQTLDSGGWLSVASSADGSKFVATSLGEPNGPGIYTSINSGVDWMSNRVSQLIFQYVASSADGNKLATAVGSGSIYTSTNSGISWVSNDVPSESWSSIASSADGSKLVAVADGGGIWTSQTTPAPLLNIAPTNSNLNVSWLVPSTNFVLQQSLDLSSWTDVTDLPALNLTNLQEEVVLSPTNDSVFYRLESR